MKKLLFPALILMSLSAMFSCKKEVNPLREDVSGVPTEEVSSISSQDISEAKSNTSTSNTRFGVQVSAGSSSERLTIADKFGVQYVRAATILKDFRGKDPVVDQYLAHGFKVVLNLNWGLVQRTKDGKIPVPFQKDLVTYKKQLETVLDKYKPEVAVIENEPTTSAFHSGTMEDYIAMLRVAVDVCRAKGVKVADGGIHVAIVQQVMRGGNLKGKAADVKKLIDAYKTIDLDYVNLHTAASGTSYPAASLKQVADYLRATTGKPVMSNEFSVHSSSPSLITSLVDGFKAAGYEYAIIRSGEGDGGAIPLHSGMNLLPNGVAYRDAIK
jgi:hypothetical protein